jgi:hypothetical protein
LDVLRESLVDDTTVGRVPSEVHDERDERAGSCTVVEGVAGVLDSLLDDHLVEVAVLGVDRGGGGALLEVQLRKGDCLTAVSEFDRPRAFDPFRVGGQRLQVRSDAGQVDAAVVGR